MKARVPPMLIAAALLAPALAFAEGALGQARAVAGEPVNFDGGRAHLEADPVRAGSTNDPRTASQIAKDEQVKADSRAALKAATPGPDKEVEPPKPNEWTKGEHIISGLKGAFVGLLIGSLWGMMGLGIGALIGGLIGYGLSRFAAKEA